VDSHGYCAYTGKEGEGKNKERGHSKGLDTVHKWKDLGRTKWGSGEEIMLEFYKIPKRVSGTVGAIWQRENRKRWDGESMTQNQ